MGLHKFYHVDRFKQLKEGDVLQLNERNLSRFGSIYWDAITTKLFNQMTDAEQREFLLEDIKQGSKYAAYISRMQAFFGSNSLEDAKRFYEAINPKQDHPVPVYEVFASKFWSLDMNWLDFSNPNLAERRADCVDYWHARISNHNPESGDRRGPLLEVMMALPVTVGKIATWL